MPLRDLALSPTPPGPLHRVCQRRSGNPVLRVWGFPSVPPCSVSSHSPDAVLASADSCAPEARPGSIESRETVRQFGFRECQASDRQSIQPVRQALARRRPLPVHRTLLASGNESYHACTIGPLTRTARFESDTAQTERPLVKRLSTVLYCPTPQPPRVADDWLRSVTTESHHVGHVAAVLEVATDGIGRTGILEQSAELTQVAAPPFNADRLPYWPAARTAQKTGHVRAQRGGFRWTRSDGEIETWGCRT